MMIMFSSDEIDFRVQILINTWNMLADLTIIMLQYCRSGEKWLSQNNAIISVSQRLQNAEITSWFFPHEKSAVTLSFKQTLNHFLSYPRLVLIRLEDKALYSLTNT